MMLVYNKISATIGPLSGPIQADFSAVGYSDDGTALIIGDNGVVVQYTPAKTQ